MRSTEGKNKSGAWDKEMSKVQHKFSPLHIYIKRCFHLPPGTCGGQADTHTACHVDAVHDPGECTGRSSLRLATRSVIP